MKAAAALVEGGYHEARVRQVAGRLRREVGGEAGVGLAFVSSSYRDVWADFCETVRIYGHCVEVVGCTAWGVMANGEELEGRNGFSLLLVERGAPWRVVEGGGEDAPGAHWVMGHPLRGRLETMLAEANARRPWEAWCGGLAGGTTGTVEEIALFHNERESEAPWVGVAMGPELRAVVSQGCRPIGEPALITRVQRNAVCELGGRPAYAALGEVYAGLAEGERAALSGNLLAGIACDEHRDRFGRGDFLIRNILGADVATGALFLGALPRVGQTLQFQLRDRESAAADLERGLQSLCPGGAPEVSLGCFCLGRGERFFGERHHDSARVRRVLGPHPQAGFFGNGEIGPVNGANYLHAYSAVVAAWRGGGVR